MRTERVIGRCLLAVALWVVAIPRAGGQATSEPVSQATTAGAYVPTMTFDVASIRETKPDSERGFVVGGTFEPLNSSSLRLMNNDLLNLVVRAYGVDGHSVEGFPRDWGWHTFNVEAKADAATDERLAKLDKQQVWLEQQHMMQVLLADRMKLKVHWETRDDSTYDLVVVKPGRLVSTGAPPGAEELKAFGDRPIPPLYQHGSSRTGFEYTAHGATTADIARMLGQQFGHPVTDKTGLTGKYDFDLKSYQIRARERADSETNPWLPLDTAIQDQLGLKLVPSRGQVQKLVIDHVEMPSEN